jgi:hypothetical protein
MSKHILSERKPKEKKSICAIRGAEFSIAPRRRRTRVFVFRRQAEKQKAIFLSALCELERAQRAGERSVKSCRSCLTKNKIIQTRLTEFLHRRLPKFAQNKSNTPKLGRMKLKKLRACQTFHQIRRNTWELTAFQ